MAHVEKYNRAAVGHMFAHYERAKDAQGEYLKFGNQDINTEKSNLNYNLAPFRNISQGEFVRQRCSEVKCLQRKDVNVMCCWVVTAPEAIKEAPVELQEKFFKETYSFLESKYGKDNVISAYVHNDENAPHLHFSFVPVFTPLQGEVKVSANDLLTRTHLKRFHPELERHLENALGFNVGILNGATAGGNKTIAELKAESLNKDYDKALEKYEALNAEVENLQLAINRNKTSLKFYEQRIYEIENQKKDIEYLKDQIEIYEDILKNTPGVEDIIEKLGYSRGNDIDNSIDR